MLSLEESHRSTTSSSSFTRPHYTPPSSSPSPSRLQKHLGRSMRTIRSNFHHSDYTNTCSFTNDDENENLTDSVIDVHLQELSNRKSSKTASSTSSEDFLHLSQAFSDFSECSSDVSGELQRLACFPEVLKHNDRSLVQIPKPEPCEGFLERESFSTEIIESISPKDLQPTVKLCVDSLRSSTVAVTRSAAAKLWLLAKNRSDNRALIGESGAMIPLLRCTDPQTQEHSITTLLNLSLLDDNKPIISGVGRVKSLIYVLKTGTEVSKQNAACALLSLA